MFSNKLSLSVNQRGIFSLDTSIGCWYGTRSDKRGCYGDCYAERISRMYGYDFSKVVDRIFVSRLHEYSIMQEIQKAKTDFIRIGTMGDPSNNWENCVNIAEKIIKNQPINQLKLFGNKCYKKVIIVTKHWQALSESQLIRLGQINAIINTSVSCLDDDLLDYRLQQYKRIKSYCKSVLRVVTFNINDEYLNELQNKILENDNVTETIFRPSKNSKLVKSKLINTEKVKFINNSVLTSMNNKNTYFGTCANCIEKCGLNL